MYDNIETIPAPRWLYADKLVFNLKNVLTDSLYYPASGFDGTPVKYLRGHVHSFIDVAYEETIEQLIDAIQNRPYLGFHVIHQQSISVNKLIPNSWDFSEDAPELQAPREEKKIKPFCEWFIFENADKERFSLLHICAEGVAAFKDLYLRHNIKPKIIFFKRCDGFSGNWTTFRDDRGPLASAVFSKPDLMPDYLCMEHTAHWKGYSEDICSESEFVVWRKNHNFNWRLVSEYSD